tara:strand:+ start:11554 stop:11937 length:384 start_codon:yes stop_codon:yes gene_type:complete
MKLLVLTVPSTAYAAAVSSLMWDLCAPAPSTTTQYLYSWIVHPGAHDGPSPVALNVGDGQFYVQPTATADAIIAAASLGDEEAAQLSADILATRGSKVDVEGLLPASIATNLLTRQQAEDQGWFAGE